MALSEPGSDMLAITSQFSPLKTPVSPVSPDSVDQVVVESPTPYGAPVHGWFQYILGRRTVGDT